ncbi:helix-turn-helix domain-containing protein [Micromonospora sp. NPDC047548]|uniref:helix-turn-helix domain-containing protein n=1 Tax=Micromonospora sp. NPDC047548 TaxID=3155624 RepID=UPI0033E5F813
MLTLADREEISRGLAEGLEYKQIGVLIGRDPSVVSREVARHGGRAGYRAATADTAAGVARRRPKTWAVERVPGLREVVREPAPAGCRGDTAAGWRDDFEN